MSTVEELTAKLAAAEADRDMWKAKAEAVLKTPATQYPVEGRSWLNSTPEYPKYDMAQPVESFLSVQKSIVEDVLRECSEGYEMPPEEVEWVRKMLEYNTVGGKMNRGLMVVESGIKIFEARGLTVSNDDLCRFAVLGWCIEFLQGWLLILDDIMDGSTTRRGRPCWYRNDHVQLIAINDALMLEGITYKLLKRHFGHNSSFPQLMDLFIETTFQTEVGQLLDTLCMNLDLPQFTTKRWELIVKYKTSFYSFYMAVAASMILAGITDVAEYDWAREILVVMGVYFQAQDDHLDCYGTPEQIGKVGTDIQDKKCGWLFVHAFHERASPEQKEYLLQHYGKCQCGSPEEQKIKHIYTELGLPELYAQYEQQSYDRILSMKRVDAQVPWSVFETFLAKIYKRTK